MNSSKKTSGYYLFRHTIVGLDIVYLMDMHKDSSLRIEAIDDYYYSGSTDYLYDHFSNKCIEITKEEYDMFATNLWMLV